MYTNPVKKRGVATGMLVFLCLICSAKVNGLNIKDHYNYGQVKKLIVQGVYGYTFTCKEYLEEKMSCRFYRQSLIDRRRVQSCKLNIDSEYISGVSILSSGMAAVSWYAPINDAKINDIHERKYQINTTIIDMNDCNTIKASVKRLVGENSVIGKIFNMISTVDQDDGTFEIFFNNPEACEVSLCKSSFDAKGNELETVDFFKSDEIHQFISVHKIDWLKKTYLVTERIGIRVGYSLFTSDGQKKFLTKVHHDLFPAVSTNYNTIRLCTKSAEEKKQISCDTFDADGKEVSSINVNLEHEVTHVHLENLYFGEFFLFTATKKWNHNYVTRVSSNGTLKGTLELTGFPTCKSSFCVESGDLKSIQDSLCRFALLLDPLSQSYIFTNKCFNLEDLE